MAEKTKSLEKTARNTFEDSSPSRTPTPSVSPSSFDPAAIQVAAGNMAMQRVAREEGGEDAPGRSESALNFLSAYLQQPPSAPKPPEPKMHGPDPAPKKWGDPGFGAADGGMFGGPGKTTQKPAAPFMGGDANAATAASKSLQEHGVKLQHDHDNERHVDRAGAAIPRVSTVTCAPALPRPCSDKALGSCRE